MAKNIKKPIMSDIRDYRVENGVVFKVSTHLVIPVFNDTGIIQVLRCSKVLEKKYLVIEEGLFTLPLVELTKEEILSKYGVKLPKEFLYETVLASKEPKAVAI